MDNVLCPHCGQAVLCNPQLAAQAVACPGCQGHFTMPATALPPTVTTSLPPPVIRTSHSEPPPRIVTAPPKQPHATVKRPRQDQRTLLVAGIAAAVLLLVGIGLVVVINWPPGESGAVAADGDRRSRGDLTGGHENELLDPSRPLPPLDQLTGRPFPADHPDAEARIAEASERKISVMQGGGKVQLGDVSVADIPTGDYPGFQFGMITEKDGRILLTTNDGKEPLQIPRSFASHRSIVQRFLEQHHGAAIRIEQLTDQPYYLARLKSDQEQRPGATPETHHGRSREKIQANLDQLAELGIRYSISKLERIGTVVRAVHRVGPAQTDEEFLVVNNKVVLHFGSIVSVITGGD